MCDFCSQTMAVQLTLKITNSFLQLINLSGHVPHPNHPKIQLLPVSLAKVSTGQLEKVSTVGKWETEVTYNKFGKKTSEESLR